MTDSRPIWWSATEVEADKRASVAVAQSSHGIRALAGRVEEISVNVAQCLEASRAVRDVGVPSGMRADVEEPPQRGDG
ncbi:hypothetical protein CTI14_05600, partial [Methylobacterium radiotolerans]